jgi:hypothetical protein
MPPNRKVLFRSAAFLALVAAAGAALAQLRVDPSAWSSGHDGIRLHSEEFTDLHVTPERPIDPYAFRRGLFSSMGLYEYKPIGAVEGRYTKPHYAVGLHSELMRDALSLTGLEAESCVAPMLRLRTRQAVVAGTSGVCMTVFARCTFR